MGVFRRLKLNCIFEMGMLPFSFNSIPYLSHVSTTDPMKAFSILVVTVFLMGCVGSSDQVPEKVIKEFKLDEGTNMAATLSPDKNTIAFDLLGRIWLMPVDGGEALAITDSLGNARQPKWSPDGSQITFQAYWEGNWHVYIINVDGSGLKQMTSGAFDYREPDWSPDGTQLVFSSDRGGSYDIWSMDIVAEQINPVTNDAGNEYDPRWSPDGNRLAYVSAGNETSGIIIQDMTSGKRKSHYQGQGRLAGISWNESGSELVFNERKQSISKLMSVSLEDGKSTTITSEEEDVFPFPVSWTAEGDMLFTASGKIKLRNQETIKDVPFSVPLILDRTPYERRKRDLRSEGPFPVKGILDPALSPDGKQVVFTALQDLYLRREDGSLVQMTNDPYVQIMPVWSPDGSEVAYCSDVDSSFGIWIYNLEERKIRKILETDGSPSGISWSPNGNQIAFTQSFGPRGGALNLVEINTGESRVIAGDLGSSVGTPTWSADSRILALSILDPYSSLYREGVNRVFLFSVDDGEMRPQEAVEHWSFGKRGNDGPKWSPDGKHMVIKGKGTLWLMPVDEYGDATDEPTRLTNELSDMPSWSGDSRSVLYLATDRLKVVNIEDGSSRELPMDLSWKRNIPDTKLVLRRGNIIDVRTGEILENMDITIEGSEITSISSNIESEGTREIDATGTYIIPGLIDNHAHEESSNGEVLGRKWLAWGVTTMRNPSSNPYDVLCRREAIQSGTALGPRIFYTGGPIDGTRIYYDGGATTESVEQIEMELNRADVLEYDLIKTYVRLPDPLQRQVVLGAHKLGIPVTSHEVFPAVGYGTDGTEHVSGTSRIGYSSKLSRTFNSYGDVTDLLAKSGMSFTPTTSILAYKYLMNRDSSIFQDNRWQAFVGSRPRGIPGMMDAEWEDSERLYQNLIQMVRDVHDKGGFVVAGTDSPIIPYGFGLHLELETYQDAGLTPLEVLQTATINNARLLNAWDDLGSVEVGKLADLVILEANPLEDIRNTRKIRTVIKNGEVYDIEELLVRP